MNDGHLFVPFRLIKMMLDRGFDLQDFRNGVTGCDEWVGATAALSWWPRDEMGEAHLLAEFYVSWDSDGERTRVELELYEGNANPPNESPWIAMPKPVRMAMAISAFWRLAVEVVQEAVDAYGPRPEPEKEYLLPYVLDQKAKADGIYNLQVLQHVGSRTPW